MSGLWRCVLSLMVLGCGAAAALAQPAPSAPIAPFRLISWGGELFARGRFQQEHQEQSSSSFTSNQQEWFFEEGVGLHGVGYIYHPNLLDWQGDFRIGASQDRLTINGQDYVTNGMLLGYNFAGLFFKEKPISFRLFASRNQDFLTRDFAPAVEVINRREGGEVFTKGSFPATLLLEHVVDQETGDLRDVDRDTWHARFGITDQRNPDWLTRLTFDHSDTAETATYRSTEGGPATTEDLPDTIDEANLTNYWKFGKGPDKNTLSGEIRAMDRRGYFDERLFSIDERLELVHSKTFSTFYRGMFQIDDTDEQNQRTATGEIGFLKRIYESLDLTGRLVYDDEEFDDGFTHTGGGFINASYRKQTPIGQYTSSLLLGEEIEQQQSAFGQRRILNEPVRLVGISYSRLSQPDVLLGSVQVTDQNLVPYVEGVDYILRTTGNVTEIARVATGSIPDGQVVLVSYTIQVAQEAVFTIDHLGWNNRLQLNRLPLAFYANFNLLNDNLISGTDPGYLDREHDFLGGAEFDYKQFMVAAEYETRDQQLYPPYTAERVRASYMRSLTRTLDFAVGAQLEHLQYRNAAEFGLLPGQDVLNSVGGFLNVTAKVTPSSLIRFRSDLTRTQGREDTLLFRNALSFEWTYKKLDFSIEGAHDIFEQEDISGTADRVMFTVKRAF